jgi:hypothetical protein
MPKIQKIKDVFDKSYKKKNMLFDMPFRIGLIGRSGSGKTNMLINLLNDDFYGKDFESDDIYIVSGSLATDDKIKNLVERRKIPLENLYNGYKEHEMEELYDNLSTNYKVSLFENKKPDHSLIIFDDISFSNSLKNTSGGAIDKFSCNSRKFLCNITFTSQKFTQLSTTVRENLNGLICASCSDKQLEIISEDFNYMGCKKKFRTTFRSLTDEKFTFFICNLTNEKQNRYLNSDFEPVCVCDKNKMCKNKMI